MEVAVKRVSTNVNSNRGDKEFVGFVFLRSHGTSDLVCLGATGEAATTCSSMRSLPTMLQASNAKQVLQPAAGFAGTGRWRCWNRLWRGVASSTRDVGTAFAVCWKRQTNCYSGAKALSSRPATCYNETR